MLTEDSIPKRDQVIDLIKNLSEDASLKEIIYYLYIRNQILEAQQEIKKGFFIPDVHVKDRLKKWLS